MAISAALPFDAAGRSQSFNLEAHIAHIQISAKLDNPPLSYSDLISSNLRAADRLGFDRKWISTTSWYPGTHNAPCTKFHQSTMHG